MLKTVKIVKNNGTYTNFHGPHFHVIIIVMKHIKKETWVPPFQLQ